ncbi:MAG: hypothetical protein IJ426_03520 [Clostridia bacterium]|nr:hypothetical protein [Clostridia bacterium]
MYIDIHAHILPAVDDGAKNIDESLALLKMLKDQNVGAVAVSPHFYPRRENSVSEYKERIAAAYDRLISAKDDGLPEIYLGCEVHFFKGISLFSDIRSLCIGKSNYILIEFPYRSITSSMANEIAELYLNHGLMPILAHIERYRSFEGFEHILKLIDDGFALGQVNAYSLLEFKPRRATVKLIKDGFVSFIASDCHSSDEIPPRIGEALRRVEKKCGKQKLEEITANSQNLYNKIKGND